MNRTFNFINNKKSSIAFNQTNLYTIAEESPSLDYLAMHKIKFQEVLPELLAEYNQKKVLQCLAQNFESNCSRVAEGVPVEVVDRAQLPENALFPDHPLDAQGLEHSIQSGIAEAPFIADSFAALLNTYLS